MLLQTYTSPSLAKSQISRIENDKVQSLPNGKSEELTDDQFSSLLDSTLNFSDNPFQDCASGTDIKNKLDPIRRAVKTIPELASMEKSSCNDLLKSVQDILKAANSKENTSVVAGGTTDFFGLYKNGTLVKTFQIPGGRTDAKELGGIIGVKQNGPVQLLPLGSSANMSK